MKKYEVRATWPTSKLPFSKHQHVVIKTLDLRPNALTQQALFANWQKHANITGARVMVVEINSKNK